jgi:hypothetical protein
LEFDRADAAVWLSAEPHRDTTESRCRTPAFRMVCFSASAIPDRISSALLGILMSILILNP